MMSSSSGGGTASISQSSRADASPQQIQKLLDENAQIIKAIVEAQNLKGKSMDIIQYQQILHRNLVYLAGLADPRVDIHQILPSPGSSNLLQSQRAPPPNQTISSAPQNMTPPPSSTSPLPPMPPTTSMTRPPNAAVSTMGQVQPSSQWGGTPPPSSLPQQQMMSQQYQMKGYAPAPWLSQSQGNYGTNVQQRISAERRQQQMLRLHQEKLIRSQQARQMSGQPGGMSTLPPGAGMYPPMQAPPGYMGSGVSQAPPPMGGYSQPPGMPPQMDM